MSPSELARTTLDLCAIPSVTGQEGALADEVERRLRGRIDVERRGNCVLARAERSGAARLLLVGHLDTVPGKPGDGAPRQVEDRLYGLGASDMKAGLAVMLALADVEKAVDLGLVFYDREEGPWAESGLGPLLDEVAWLREADLALCMEPTDNVVQLGCLGTLHARVVFHGRAAHSARPWQGENAIHKAAPLLGLLAARPPREVDCGGHLYREVLSATLARGGSVRNVIPDRFELNLNYRFAPGRAPEAVIAELRELCAGAEVEIDELAPSGRVVTDNALLRRLLARGAFRVEAKQAWTDVARLSAQGVDAANFGPGLTAQAHQAGEYASLEHVARCFAVLRSFVGEP